MGDEQNKAAAALNVKKRPNGVRVWGILRVASLVEGHTATARRPKTVAGWSLRPTGIQASIVYRYILFTPQPNTFLSRESATETSSQLPRCAQLAAFGTMSYVRVAGRLAGTEEGSGVPAFSSAQRPAVTATLRRIARDHVIRPALLQAMSEAAHGVPDAVSPRGGSEWTAAAAGTRHFRYQAPRVRRAEGIRCPFSASTPISPVHNSRSRVGEQSGRSPLYGSDAVMLGQICA